MHPIDIAIIALYLAANAAIGIWVRRRATRHTDSFFLGDRNVPWWMLGLSGCSSYIDVGGTMGLIGAMYYLGLQSIWLTHIVWGWFIICFYMAFQAKYIRRSGVSTFAEWNRTRFGDGRDTEWARLAAATFLLVLMTFNLIYIAVGTGKFAEEFFGVDRWLCTVIAFGVVGVYVTLGGMFGVILTDMFQTALIAVGAVVLAWMAFSEPTVADASKAAEWTSLAPAWTLWDGYAAGTTDAYRHYQAFGPMLLAGFAWLVCRVLGGPNVWDFQFFLTTRSPREAQLAAGTWTVGYTLRWIIACAFLVLGIRYLGAEAAQDAEKIMPRVVLRLSVGLQGAFIAILLAAFMSTLSAMITVTSSVITNDFLRRYFTRSASEKRLVGIGQVASVVTILVAVGCSLLFQHVTVAWETMIFVVVTVINAPAAMRWHWWRFGPRAFVWSMALSAAFLVLRHFVGPALSFPELSVPASLATDSLACLGITLACGFAFPSAPMDALVAFYSRVRPFGVWGPVRREAVRRGLVPPDDRMPAIDVLNGIVTAAFQLGLAIVPFCVFLRKWGLAAAWGGALAVLAVALYFTWYRHLPSADER